MITLSYMVPGPGGTARACMSGASSYQSRPVLSKKAVVLLLAAAAACVLTVAGWLLGIRFMKKKEF